MARRNRSIVAALAATLTLVVTPALAQKHYSPGASDTEIKIGTTTPYSGPASAYSAGAVSATAYFAMINERGGGTAARSISSASTTLTARPRRWSRSGA
jgi:branched-chain amino acid transport system substrate-binding protein